MKKETRKMKGIITDIQRASIHDGPGLRTTVFFKGCNFHCAWCHNPETIKLEPEIVFEAEKCIHCGKCELGCYTGAKTLCGKEYEVEQILNMVEEDRVYYGKEGGMTISGGEPSMQAKFLKEILEGAQARKISVGIETNLSMEFALYKEMVPYIDYWIIDIKMYDDKKHEKYTGASNKKVLNNVLQLDRYLKKNMIIRTPIITGVNDTEQELNLIMQFVNKLNNVMYYELLPYHPLGLSKKVEENQYVERFETPDAQKLKNIALGLKQKYDLKIKIANVSV